MLPEWAMKVLGWLARKNSYEAVVTCGLCKACADLAVERLVHKPGCRYAKAG